MSDHLSSLFLALGIFSVGFISIGPNILAVIGTSMERGRTQGAALALGVGIGSGLWATMTVAGLSALITAYAGAMTALKLVGAAYLMWLAWKAFRSAAHPDGALVATAAQGENLFWRGLSVQMSNPKAALHWIAIVAIGLGPNPPLWLGVALVLSATFLSILGHLAYAMVFSTAPVVAFYRRARRWISAALGVFFALAAGKLALDR